MFSTHRKSDAKHAPGWMEKSAQQIRSVQSMGRISKEQGVAQIRPPFDPYNMEIEGSKFPHEVPVFIEVSKESRNKYEWDHDLGVMRLDRVLHSAVFYPYDYGFIPQTLCGDGDPLDVLVMSTCPLMPGCVVQARVICYMIMEDEKGTDEKVLAVNVKDAHFHGINTMKDLHEHPLREIAEFFSTYKSLEKDKWAKVGGWKGTEDTLSFFSSLRARVSTQKHKAFNSKLTREAPPRYSYLRRYQLVKQTHENWKKKITELA